ncbi:nucleotidyltransferase family protein [Sulfurospirillum multivorans]|uniref:Nucleotidyltransferase n=2 Tax=Sulfurospirillum multivorans TaxID=66821 RepID=A0AA86APF0_SULMK|nr:nucleotidyltransferase family protein [Sulfurospirillum multivorans]AHJ14289.1 nucleotidyltransferase [Sulfurospirillum multivorans DSM 12446]QEH07774.1 nucleotidyltransferase [Sulfurospirillum multivorans]
MSEKELILQKLSALKAQFAGHYHITSLALFGSTARGEATEKSDIDLLVDFSQTPDLLTFIELEEKLKSALGKNVDLVPKRKLRAELCQNILKEAIAV